LGNYARTYGSGPNAVKLIPTIGFCGRVWSQIVKPGGSLLPGVVG